MILALDTNVLVNWALREATFHEPVRRLVAREKAGGARFGVADQVVYEFLHVATDARRFENPMPMKAALRWVRQLSLSAETEPLHGGPGVAARATELLTQHGLGRKRILDTVLAATLEASGVRQLATLDPRGFSRFGFLEVVDPRRGSPGPS